MVPQISKRQIGTVAILDVKGALTGPWALRSREFLGRELALCDAKKIVLNMRPTVDLDTLGARTLFECIPQGKEIGVLRGKSGVMELIDRLDRKKDFRQFQDEKELATLFGEDFLQEPQKNDRRAPRLRTAFPLEFFYERESDRFKFKAVVTNLSESGLFAEYIDLETAEESLIRLNPYDFNVLHLTLFLPKRKTIHTQGKVAHRRMDGDQVGIGIQFLDVDSKDQQEIKRFLNAVNNRSTTNGKDGQ